MLKGGGYEDTPICLFEGVYRSCVDVDDPLLYTIKSSHLITLAKNDISRIKNGVSSDDDAAVPLDTACDKSL